MFQCMALPDMATRMAAAGVVDARQMHSGCRIEKLIGISAGTPTGEMMDR